MSKRGQSFDKYLFRTVPQLRTYMALDIRKEDNLDQS